MLEENNIDNKTSNDNNAKHIEASVKWYNPLKGYGFLSLGSNLAEVMIHFSALDKIGCPYIKVGDRVVCDLGCGNLGLYVSRVIEVKFSSPEPRSLAHFIESHSRLKHRALGVDNIENLKEAEGVIKWYNPDKGYGFISPQDGTKEIFLHFSVLRTVGYKTIMPGTRVLAKFSSSERGPEAHTLRVLCKNEGAAKNIASQAS